MQNNAQPQAVNVAAYPQLCGFWMGDEWPEAILSEQHDNFVEFCAELYGKYGRDNANLQGNYGRVEE